MVAFEKNTLDPSTVKIEMKVQVLTIWRCRKLMNTKLVGYGLTELYNLSL
jgi:hypothetical protein